MKQLFWTLLVMSMIIINCSGPKPLPKELDPSINLPGMPGVGTVGDFPEPDGLIGVDPSPQFSEFFILDGIRIVLDDPYDSHGLFDSPLKLIVYALPNGNSIEWTMGKQTAPEDDWHFDIQHIRAQTEWLRQNTPGRYVTAYLQAPNLSWPAWKKSSDPKGEMIREVFDTLLDLYPNASVHLNSHSGGGSLLNGLIASQDDLPANVKRISFIDSNYGYTTQIGENLEAWLDSDPGHALTIFAYNDSIALYEGKPFVSATGGTWYRTKMMLRELGQHRAFMKKEHPALISEYRSAGEQVLIMLKDTDDRGIYHTEQVELNGFIHTVLFGTEYESKGYEYFGARCYEGLIRSDTPEFEGNVGRK